MDSPHFPEAVFTVWWLGLALTLLVFVPLAVYWLHMLWRTARSIQLYARDALAAAGGIAGHTVNIPALGATIAVATEILQAAGEIEKKTGTIADVLAARAGER
jgi:hypothetical protein